MKIDAKIKWLIDEPELNISVDKTETVLVDADYCECDESDIIGCIENELTEKYGTGFYVGQDDFVIMNMVELLEALDYDEDEAKWV